MPEIRIFWREVPVLPGMNFPENSQIIWRTPTSLSSDSVNYEFNIPNQRTEEVLQNIVSYIDVVILREEQFENQFFELNNHQIITIDDQDTDQAKSRAISTALFGDTRPYTTEYNLVGVPNNVNDNYRNYRTPIITERILPQYSVWCEIHNKLMITADVHIFPRYAIVSNDPVEYTRLFSRRMYPLHVANSWQKGWSVIVKRNDNIDIIKSFNKYTSAYKNAVKYIKRILDQPRLRDFPDFKNNQTFVHNDLTVSIHKEKELI